MAGLRFLTQSDLIISRFYHFICKTVLFYWMLLPIDIFVPIHRLSLANLKVICPTAPVIPITLNLGFRMPAWFDIESLENLEEARWKKIWGKIQIFFVQETDIEGVRASAELVYKHIDVSGAVEIFPAFSLGLRSSAGEMWLLYTFTKIYLVRWSGGLGFRAIELLSEASPKVWLALQSSLSQP